MAEQSKNLIPFRMAARRRSRPVSVTSGATYSAGGQFSFDLPKIGFVEAINLRVTGTMTLSTTGVLTNRSPWDVLSRLQLKVNLGAAMLYDTSGYGNYVVQRMSRAGFDPVALADTTQYAAPVTSTGGTWTLTYRIPVAANWHREFGIGLLNLQAQELQATVQGSWGAGTGLISNFSSLAMTMDASYDYYEVPDPRLVDFPPIILHRIIESRQTITAAGDQEILLPREGMLYRMAHITQANSAALTDPTDFRILLNGADRLRDMSNWQLRAEMLRNYRSNLPAHWFVHDFWCSEGQPGEGDGRDMLNMEEFSEVKSIFSTATAPSGTLNAVDTIREFAQVVAW